LGFYSLVALVVGSVQSHLHVAQQNHLQHYRQLDELLVASYVGSLAYWVFSFAQKEAERREFSPQMQGLLLAVAGAARSSRIALTNSSSGKSRKGRDL
jgi:glucose uptake protein GlcU